MLLGRRRDGAARPARRHARSRCPAPVPPPTSTCGRVVDAAVDRRRRPAAPRLRLPVRERRRSPGPAPRPASPSSGPAPRCWTWSATRSRPVGSRAEHGRPRPGRHPTDRSTLDGRRARSSTRSAHAGAPSCSRPSPAVVAAGMRAVSDRAELPAAFERAASEARGRLRRRQPSSSSACCPAPGTSRCRSSGTGPVRPWPSATGTAASSAGTRSCWRSRRRRGLAAGTARPRLADDAVALTSALRLPRRRHRRVPRAAGRTEHVFLEMNPRLQVEHTVTEAGVPGSTSSPSSSGSPRGATLDELELPDPAGPAAPAASAVQVRHLQPRPSGRTGRCCRRRARSPALHLPGGPGIRVDTAAYAGWHVSARFDSLLAKSSSTSVGGDRPTMPWSRAATRLLRSALREVRIDGVATNLGLLRALLDHPAFTPGAVDTGFLDEHRYELCACGPPGRSSVVPAPAAGARPRRTGRPTGTGARRPLGRRPAAPPCPAPLQGTVVDVAVAVGDEVTAGTPLVVLEAMKMEQVVTAPHAGTVAALAVAVDQTVSRGRDAAVPARGRGLGARRRRRRRARPRRRAPRPRRAARAQGAARRRGPAGRGGEAARGRASHRAREPRRPHRARQPRRVRRPHLRRAAQPPQRRGPDGPDTGRRADRRAGAGQRRPVRRGRGRAGTRRAAPCCPTTTWCSPARRARWATARRTGCSTSSSGCGCPPSSSPRAAADGPGDTDYPIVSALDVPTFAAWGRLSGLVPRIGIVGGRCFAGNAAIFGCSDITIATADSSIGMGGPAMIEGGGLGVVGPDEVGPAAVQARQRRHRRAGRRRRGRGARPRGRRWATSRAGRRTGSARTSGGCASWCRRTGCGSTTSAR